MPGSEIFHSESCLSLLESHSHTYSEASVSYSTVCISNRELLNRQMEKRPVVIYAIFHVPNVLLTFCHRPQLLCVKCMQAHRGRGEDIKMYMEKGSKLFCFILLIFPILSTVRKKQLLVFPFDFVPYSYAHNIQQEVD